MTHQKQLVKPEPVNPERIPYRDILWYSLNTVKCFIKYNVFASILFCKLIVVIVAGKQKQQSKWSKRSTWLSIKLSASVIYSQSVRNVRIRNFNSFCKNNLLACNLSFVPNGNSNEVWLVYFIKCTCSISIPSASARSTNTQL